MGFSSEVAMERAMKVQEVMLRAMAKRITWWQAAEILGMSCRSLRRWKGRYERWGYDGLYDRQGESRVRGGCRWRWWRKCCGCTRNSILTATCGTFTRSCRTSTASGSGTRGCSGPCKGPGWCERGGSGVRAGPCRGCCCTLDGSRHRWFGDDRWYDLLVILDDASSEIYYAHVGGG